MAFLDIVGLLTTPVAVGPAARRASNRFEPGLDSGQTFQPMPTAAAPTSGTFQEAAENLYSAHYIAYACINAYGDAIASLTARVYERSHLGHRGEVFDGDLNNVLIKPNMEQDWYEFIHALVISFLIGGEGPVEKVKNVLGTRVVNLRLMRPDRFGPIVSTRNGLVGYQFMVGTQGFGYEPDEIMFYKLTNPTNEWRGLSPLTAARLSIETDMASGRYNRNFMLNGSIPGGVLQTDQDLIPRERKEIRGEWEDVHRGVNKSGRVAVLDKGLKFDGASLSQRDAQWLEGRQHDAESICAVYRVPPGVLGIERSTNRSTVAEMLRAWYKGPVRSLCRRFEFKLTHELARGFDKSLFVEFDMDDMLRPELDKLAEAGSKAWWIKPNEKRRIWHNLPPAEGGDELYIPVNMAAGGEPVNEVVPLELPPPEVGKVVRPFGR